MCFLIADIYRRGVDNNETNNFRQHGYPRYQKLIESAIPNEELLMYTLDAFSRTRRVTRAENHREALKDYLGSMSESNTIEP